MQMKVTKEDIEIALEIHEGTVCRAAVDLGITRKTLKKYIDADDDLMSLLEDLKETSLDITEEALMSNISKGKEKSIIFKLRTQGASRGYIEKQEIFGKDGAALTFLQLVQRAQESNEK